MQDKTITTINAKGRIHDYLQQKEWINSAKVQQLCGFNKDQAYRILRLMCEDGILEKSGSAKGTKYKLKRD